MTNTIIVLSILFNKLNCLKVGYSPFRFFDINSQVTSRSQLKIIKMTTRKVRIESALRSIKEIASDLDPSDEYYFKAWVQEYFKMKGLNLQVQRRD